MKLPVFFVVVCLACSCCHSRSTTAPQVVITSPTGRKVAAKDRYTITEVERGIAAPVIEKSPFDIQHPVYPNREQLDRLKQHLGRGGTLWYFQGLDSGWAVVRDGEVLCVVVTNHEY